MTDCRPETRAEELRRLINEYETGEGSEKEEAWNLMADFTYENYVDICRGLRLVDGVGDSMPCCSECGAEEPYWNAANAEPDKLRAENDRMRSALEYILLTAQTDGHDGFIQLCATALGGAQGSGIDRPQSSMATPSYDAVGPQALGSGSLIHASDCATHNAPALPNGKCDCGVHR